MLVINGQTLSGDISSEVSASSDAKFWNGDGALNPSIDYNLVQLHLDPVAAAVN
jgi:hypothetical protein